MIVVVVTVRVVVVVVLGFVVVWTHLLHNGLKQRLKVLGQVAGSCSGDAVHTTGIDDRELTLRKQQCTYKNISKR